jgi:uncharacterized repeat protein (TIGR01451 family)
MRHYRLFFLLVTSLLALSGLSLSILPAAAAPLAGFTDTPTTTPTAIPSDTPPPPPPTNTAGPTQPPPPTAVITDPIIVKGGDPENAPVGAVVTFNITVSNPSSVDVPGVSVVDPLPTQLDYLSGSTTQGTVVYDAGTHTVNFTIGTLAANQVVNLVIQTRINNTAQPGQAILNLAQLLEGGTPHGSSNTVLTNVVPGAMPGTGLPPETSPMPTILFAVIAALLPLLGWLGLRELRLRRK